MSPFSLSSAIARASCMGEEKQIIGTPLVRRKISGRRSGIRVN